MSRKGEIRNFSAMGGADRGILSRVSRQAEAESSSRRGIHSLVFSSSLTLAVWMTSSGCSLYTSDHVLQDS